MPAKTRIHVRRLLAGAVGSLLVVAAVSAAAPAARSAGGRGGSTATPIRHLVVIFQENVAFDHYFATYPHALNPPGEPRFVASPATPPGYGRWGLPRMGPG